jgi:hypothetical protein
MRLTSPTSPGSKPDANATFFLAVSSSPEHFPALRIRVDSLRENIEDRVHWNAVDLISINAEVFFLKIASYAVRMTGSRRSTFERSELVASNVPPGLPGKSADLCGCYNTKSGSRKGIAEHSSVVMRNARPQSFKAFLEIR